MRNYTPLPEEMRQAKPASEHTIKANGAFLNYLDFSDQSSFENAGKGFIASINPMTIMHDREKRPAFDLSAFGFLENEAPDTVNPSLWRQAQLNAQHHGLYEVTDGIYQIRSFDIANMTLIRGDTGWIIIDPLTCTESARAGLQLANEHLGERKVHSIIITHSHGDHFAGILGVTDHESVRSGEVQLIAPDHFVKEALSENVLAGNVMNRRATYMYGNLLKPSPTAFVSTGLGAALSMGSTGFIVPNDIIKKTGESRRLDGIDIEFQMTPGTEAPAEMVFYFPQFKALCMSEITSHHLHNIYTPRGAQVRDALAWASQINESIDLFGDRLDIQFASHHWPIWGREAAVDYLKKQRDLYKYIHDQTLRLANHGYTKEEIAEKIRLPDSLGKEFYNRDYYGTLHHNARAVYVKYLGFLDGNPAHLHPLPPAAQASRYLKFMGGANAVVEKARQSYEEGDYRWVCEVVNHVVMHDPEHVEGRALLADALEQLGYQAESASWRNFYLCGALELREGLPEGADYRPSEGMAKGIPLESLFQVMAMRLLGEKAAELRLTVLLDFTDHDPYLLCIENGVMHSFPYKGNATADSRLEIDQLSFKRLMMGLATAAELLEDQKMQIEGDMDAFGQLAGLFDQFKRRFPIMTPRD